MKGNITFNEGRAEKVNRIAFLRLSHDVIIILRFYIDFMNHCFVKNVVLPGYGCIYQSYLIHHLQHTNTLRIVLVEAKLCFLFIIIMLISFFIWHLDHIIMCLARCRIILYHHETRECNAYT
jgi:hypothetical protein